MLKKGLLATGIVLAGFIVFVSWDSRNIKKRAESFLSEWDHIKPGDDAQQTRLIAKQFARHSWISRDCTDLNCDYSFSFYNVWIYRLHLAPRRVFAARVTVQNNKIVYKELIFEQGHLLQVFVRVRDVGCYPCEAASNPFDVSVMGFHSVVTLTPSSTAEDRTMSNHFDLKLLTSLREFRGERDLRPALQDYLDRQTAQGKM